ncbi:4-hydroxy-2-oxoglutarate aldolase, mitochondrial [Chamberlinius hualienensis]
MTLSSNLLRNFNSIRNCISQIQIRYKHNLNVSGIFPAITTPFDNNEQIAWDKLQQNINKWNQIPFKGYLALGSTGETVNLTINERIEVVKRLRQIIQPESGKLLLAGAGCESTIETIELTKKMDQVGADAVLIVTPSYYKGKLTPSAIKQYYLQVADASPLPVILYSVPANTTIDLDPDVVVALSKHPNIIGMKDSAGDIAKLSYMVHNTKENNFQILAGSLGFLLPAIITGCVGGILASGNVLGKEACQLYQLVLDKKYDEGIKLQHRLIASNWALTKKFGIAGVKYAMDLTGLYGGRLRSPLLSLSEAEQSNLKQIFQQDGFFKDI